MVRRFGILAVILAGLVALSAGGIPAAAQGGPDGTTDYRVNLRAGPGTEFDVIVTLPPGAGMAFEARSGDLAWLLGHTTDGAARGWVAALYLSYRDGFAAVSLPVSAEVIPAAPAAPPPADPGAPASVPVVATSLDNLPVIPAVTARARDVFRRGRALGNNPRVFAKIGDCNTHSPAFMGLIGMGQYTLGPYSSLQETVAFFSGPEVNSFSSESAAADFGFTALVVTDPALSNPAVCGAGVSLLECEYARIRPSVALIMFGLQDVHFLTVGQYDASMRRVIDVSLAQGVIPVLTTFPTWAGEDDKGMLNKRLMFNEIVAALAREYDVPLLNFWRAAQALPRSGLDGDLLHLAYSGTPWVAFGGEEHEWGFTLWNLVALQTLDTLRRGVLVGE